MQKTARTHLNPQNVEVMDYEIDQDDVVVDITDDFGAIDLVALPIESIAEVLQATGEVLDTDDFRRRVSANYKPDIDGLVQDQIYMGLLERDEFDILSYDDQISYILNVAEVYPPWELKVWTVQFIRTLFAGEDCCPKGLETLALRMGQDGLRPSDGILEILTPAVRA